MPETPDGNAERETFAETLAAVAEAGRARMRPTPLAEIAVLHRRRRRRRTVVVAALAASSCAVAVSVAIAASPAARKAPMPPVGPTPRIGVESPSASLPPSPLSPLSSPSSPLSSPSSPSSPLSSPGSSSSTPSSKPSAGVSIPARYVTPQELPMESAFTWVANYVDALHAQTPLPTVCNNPLGTEVTQGVEDVRYSTPSGQETITETIYTYASETAAADRFAKITPTCGSSGMASHGGFAFAWAEPDAAADTTNHMVVVRHGKWLAVLQYVQRNSWRSYDATHDDDVVTAMLDHLRAAAVPDTAALTADQVPFPDGGHWQAAEADQPGQDLGVSDVCVSAADPVDTTAKSHTAPDSLIRTWAPGNPADVAHASENIHVFPSTGDAFLEYQKARALYAAQTCHHTEDTVGDVTSTVTPGGSLKTEGVQGFATGRSDTYVQSATTGTMNQFRTYVVLKGNTIAVLSVPVTKDHVTDSSGDQATLTALAGRLP